MSRSSVLLFCGKTTVDLRRDDGLQAPRRICPRRFLSAPQNDGAHSRNQIDGAEEALDLRPFKPTLGVKSGALSDVRTA
jgi:hypothetical protein